MQCRLIEFPLHTYVLLMRGVIQVIIIIMGGSERYLTSRLLGEGSAIASPLGGVGSRYPPSNLPQAINPAICGTTPNGGNQWGGGFRLPAADSTQTTALQTPPEGFGGTQGSGSSRRYIKCRWLNEVNMRRASQAYGSWGRGGGQGWSVCAMGVRMRTTISVWASLVVPLVAFC